MLGKALDIRRLQNRMNCLAAVGTLGAVDLTGYLPIEIVGRNINFTDRKIRFLEKAPKCPVGLFAFSCELLNSLNVGFKPHISENLLQKLRDTAISYRFPLEHLIWYHFFSVLIYC